MDDYDTLLARLGIALDDIARMKRELEADPTLEDNDHWRENLDNTGYQVSSLLSTEW